MKKKFVYFLVIFLALNAFTGISAQTETEAPKTETTTPPKTETTTPPKTETTPPPISPFEETPPKPVEPPDQDLFFREFLNMLATLGIIVTAMLVLSWYVKKMLNSRVQQLNVSSLIKIIERRALSPKAQVYIVEVHGKTVLLGESPNGLTKLAEYAGTLPAAEDQG